MATSKKAAKKLIKQISENYFKRRPAMKDEFKIAMDNLDSYLKNK